MSFTAKYPSTCGRCGDPIEPGQEIQGESGAGPRPWSHVECPNDSAARLKVAGALGLCNVCWTELPDSGVCPVCS